MSYLERQYLRRRPLITRQLYDKLVTIVQRWEEKAPNKWTSKRVAQNVLIMYRPESKFFSKSITIHLYNQKLDGSILDNFEMFKMKIEHLVLKSFDVNQQRRYERLDRVNEHLPDELTGMVHQYLGKFFN